MQFRAAVRFAQRAAGQSQLTVPSELNKRLSVSSLNLLPEIHNY
jgi:hypothetical protein